MFLEKVLFRGSPTPKILREIKQKSAGAIGPGAFLSANKLLVTFLR
jgi:hypothetical protein